MSCDGGLEVKICNPTLLKVLKNHPDLELDSCGFYGKKYDIDYENYDCAEVSGCPTNLDDLEQYFLDLVEAYSDDYAAFKEFADDFKKNYSEIKKDYKYVLWSCIDSDMEEDLFEYGDPPKSPKKGKKTSMPKTLSEIFPNMDSTKDNGLVLTEGKHFTDYNVSLHEDFIGEKDCFYLPGNVVSIDHDTKAFNSPGFKYEKFVITTNIEDFPSFCWGILGFKYFFIVDAETNEVVYSSEEDEYTSEYDFICNEDEFDALEEIIAKYTNCPNYDEEDYDEEDDE